MNSFPLCPTQVPPRIGRDRLFKRMVDELTKPTPQSLSLVGPRFFGKSVMLSALADDVKIREFYRCVIEWDLGHQLAQSDDEFIAALCKKLVVALAERHKDLSEHLAKDTAGYEELLESFEYLETEGHRVLMLWDGVDPTIGSGKLTRNLWDNLLALGRKESLVLVTSSRHKLRELIRDAHSVTSEFWLLFEPITLEAMDEDDLRAFSGKMDGQTMGKGELKEMMNWTGGIAPLVVWLFNAVASDHPAGAIALRAIIDAAEKPDEKCDGILDSLWSDCSAPAKDLYQSIAEAGQRRFSELPKPERAALIDFGLIAQKDGKATSVCKLIQNHVNGGNAQDGAMARMFGTWDTYTANIRGILERRLAQVPRFGSDLFHMVERAIEDLPDHPGPSLNSLTHIEETALDLVWTRELGTGQTLTQEIVSYWTESPRSRQRIVSQMMEEDNWQIPGERVAQLTLLQLLTGSHQDFTKRTAKRTSKDTYVLLNAIHSFRNRSQHGGGQTVDLGVAVCAQMLCVELLACLSKEAPLATV
jgi:hypothetical protein